MTKITLVMVINSEKYHEKTVQKILRNSVYDFELIWINSKKESDITINDSRVIIKQLEDNNLMQTINTAIKEARGKYIIFTNSLNILLDDTLKRGYNKLEDDRSDLIIFSQKTKISTIISRITKNKPFNIYKIREYLFKTNYQLQECLYNKEFLTDNNLEFNTNRKNDTQAFFFKTLTKADKILLYDKPLNNNYRKNKITMDEYEYLLENMEDIVEIFSKEDEILTNKANNYNIQESINNYIKINNIHKKESYGLLKKYFTKILYSKTIDDYYNSLTDKNKKDFEQVIITESVEEYDLLKKVQKDKQHINFMKRYEKVLLTEHEKIRNFNKSLISSNSWRITKILRIKDKL